jgi:hypothetical protein
MFFKLSYNLTLRKIANKIFVYFPKLKSKLVYLRDSSYTPVDKVQKEYSSDFLINIKAEIEKKKSLGL